MGFEAIGAALEEAGQAIAEWWASIGAIGQLAVRVVILGVAARALSRRPGGTGGSGVLSAQGRNLSVRQPIAPWQVVFGQARVGGDITFIFLSTDKKYLHTVITLACHASEEIGDVWMDDEVITGAMLNANGEVTAGKFSRYDPTPRHESFPAPGTSTAAHPVASVQLVSATFDTSDGGQETFQLSDVSPAAPGGGQYSRAGDVFTFGAVSGGVVQVDYTELVFVPVTRIKKSLGGEAGQPFPDLVAESEGKWTDAHRQTGHTKLYVRFLTSHLEAGAPAISAVLRGAKFYDPRTATTAWSANTALAALAYLTSTDFGLRATLSETGSAEFIAAADVCDERVLLAAATADFTADPATDAIALVTGSRLPSIADGIRVASTGTLPAGLAAATTYYPFFSAGLMKLATSLANALAGTPIDITGAGSGTHTLTYYDEPRYRANGAFRLSERPVDVLERLLASMAGMLTQVSDTWRVFAGAYEASTLTLTQSDFAGPIQIEPFLPRDKWANGAKGVFVSPASNWQPTDFPVVVPTAAYLAEDGGETIYADLDFSSFVTSSSQAQRLARAEVRERRSALTVTALFKLTAWRAFTGHSVAITFPKYGWAAKEFTILDASFAVIQGQDGPSLGVRLVLQASFAATWSWAAEDLAQGTPPSTSLPNPFAIAAPGAPVVSETLYETSGSAGVKSRATVSWTAIVDPLVKSYEVSWKNASDAEYRIVPVPQGTALDIEDLEAGLFLFAVRSLNSIAKSAWSPYTTQALLGLTAPPSDPTNFSVIASNGFAVARWDLSPDLDVKIGGRAIVRFSPLTTGATWEDGILISGTVDLPGFPGDTIMSPGLALKTGTYLLKFRDSTGNYSTNEATFVATEGMVSGFSTVVTITEDASFTGSKTQVVLSGSQIQLDTSGGSIFATGSYAFAGPYTDLTTIAIRRFEATVKASSFDIGSNIDSILSNIDDWDSIDGASVNDCNVILYARVTNDDPAGTPTWGPWTPFHVSDFNCRAAQFKLDFSSGNPNHNIAVTQLRVAIKVADVAPLASPTFTGTPGTPTAAVDTSTTQIASTAFVTNQATATTPLAPGAAAVGTSKRYARADHVHPSPAFESSETTITFTTTITAAHGLSPKPTMVEVYIRCKTTEFSYAVGDELKVSDSVDGSQLTGHCVWIDATNVGIALNAINLIKRDGTFARAAITPGNWKLIFRAYY